MEDPITALLASFDSQFLVSNALNFAYAIVALLLGLWVIKLLGKVMKRNFSNFIKEEALVGFLSKTIEFLLKIVLFIAVASMLGIKTASFIAILGTAGLAVGLALQGSLANFAGGILIIIFQPFKKGDFVTINDEEGYIHKIDILYTSLLTRLHRLVIIPNSTITSDVVINHSHAEIIRREFQLAISYESDLKLAKTIMYEEVAKLPHILQEPKPYIEVGELDEDKVIFNMFLWAKPEDYFTIQEHAIENIKLAWDAVGIEAPAPEKIVIQNQMMPLVK